MSTKNPNPCACGCGGTASPGKRFIYTHHLRRDSVERFWEKVDRNGSNGCWLWVGSVKPNGYGQLGMTDPDGRAWKAYAHRFSYELHKGSIPVGLVIDHLCRVRHCVNPDHLEVVTYQTNSLRGETVVAAHAAQTHCIHGHDFSPENTYVRPNGNRECRTCMARRHKEREDRLVGVKRIPTTSHCGKGHPLSGENLYYSPKGVWRCRACGREYAAKKRAGERDA